MEIKDKKSYYNAINEAIIVNANTDDDPEGLGRVQIYIPNEHIQYSTDFVDYMASSNKESLPGWTNYPWAITLVDDLDEGNVVYCGNIDNSGNKYIVLGLDVNNPANQKSSEAEGGGTISGILDLAMPIIIHNEVGISINDWPDNIPNSSYTNINPFDKGCKCTNKSSCEHKGGWSIGLIQWHHCRAFDCLYQIAKADSNWEDKFIDKSLDLYKDLKKSVDNNSSASYRTKYQDTYHPTSGTTANTCIKNMLGSDIGKEVQRAYASEDTAKSIDKVMNSPYNIKNPAVIIWLVDIMNQYGSGINKTISKASKICADNSIGGMMEQLNEFKSWCEKNLGSYSSYKSRRNTTYSYIENLYKEGKLSLGLLTEVTSMIASNYIPDAGDYYWPVPASDKINCFYGEGKKKLPYSFKYNSNRDFMGYSTGKAHAGVDIGSSNGKDGDECIAIYSGEVVAVKKKSPHSLCGYYVCIKLDKVVAKGYPYVVYMHFCKESELNVGDRVLGGQVVGYMGTTGNSTGTHLHIQLNSSGTSYGYSTSTDILPYLGKTIKGESTSGSGGGTSVLSTLFENISSLFTGNTKKSTDKSKETKADQIIAYGKRFIGNAYLYGGTNINGRKPGIDGIDCSAYTQQIFGKFGVKLPRTSAEQRKSGVQIISKQSDWRKLQKADLVFWEGHVGVYIGDDTMMHASNKAAYPKGGIKTNKFSTYKCGGKAFKGGRRVL